MNRLSVPLVSAALLWGLALLAPLEASAYMYLAPSHCPNGATWSPTNLPVDYRINEDGSDDISDFSTLKSEVEASFRAWESPCCSEFRADYAGETSTSAADSSGADSGEVVMSWREQNWPSQLGHPSKTLAFSNPRFRGCEIVSGTTLFNGTAHTFKSGDSGTGYAIGNVATHEVGHLLGLGHTPRQEATMSAKYHGSMAELSTDDKEGLCSLYGGGTCKCADDSACFGNTRCLEGTCQSAPCSVDADCSGPKRCDTDSGQCVVPSCSTDGDCQDNYRCNGDGKCVPECTICQSCESRSDCGANAVCAKIDGGGHCVTQCGANKRCPGDSRCFVVTDRGGSRYHLCLNPGADSGDEAICPESYTCSFEDGPTDDAGRSDAGIGSDASGDTGRSADTSGSCPSLGNTCTSDDHSQCGPDADGCMLLADGNQICTCSCTMDSDCGPGNSCVRVANGSSWCFPNDTGGGDVSDSSVCDDVTCGRDRVCRDGRCVSTADISTTRTDAGDSSPSEPVRVDTQQPSEGCSHVGDGPGPRSSGWIVALFALIGWRRRSFTRG